MTPDVYAEMGADGIEAVDRCGGLDWAHLCYWFENGTPWPEVAAFFAIEDGDGVGTCQEVA